MKTVHEKLRRRNSRKINNSDRLLAIAKGFLTMHVKHKGKKTKQRNFRLINLRTACALYFKIKNKSSSSEIIYIIFFYLRCRTIWLQYLPTNAIHNDCEFKIECFKKRLQKMVHFAMV